MTMMTSPTEAPLSTKGLAGKSAIVTGSTSGIGLGIARAFAGAGMSVTLNGFGDKAEIDRTRADFEKTFGVRVAYSAADMTKPDEIAGMVTEAAKAFGKVDVLVNNAGIQHVEAIETFPIPKWDAIIAINLSAAFHAIRAAVPGMKAASGGASSISRPRTRSSLRPTNRPTWPPSTASSASPRRWRWRRPSSASPAMPSAPATC